MKSTSVVYASRRGRVTSVYVPWATLRERESRGLHPLDQVRAGRGHGILEFASWAEVEPVDRRGESFRTHQDSRPSFVVQSSQTSFADTSKVRSNRIFGLEGLAEVGLFAFVGMSLTSVARRPS